MNDYFSSSFPFFFFLFFLFFFDTMVSVDDAYVKERILKWLGPFSSLTPCDKFNTDLYIYVLEFIDGIPRVPCECATKEQD